MIHGLDVEVVHALADAGRRARTFSNVTTIGFPAHCRAVYRIDLDSGETIKARCFADEATAARLFEIRRALPDAFIPAFHRHGAVLLERWIAGRIVGNSPPDDALLIEAAGLLAGLHDIDVGDRNQPNDDSLDAWRRRTQDGLRLLADRTIIDAAEAQRLFAAVERRDPQRMIVGIGHFDFCGENMLVDESGRLRVFDNERVGRGPLGFDLARTWYRWDLSPTGWTTFVGAYLSASGRREALMEFDFWSVASLVHSACLRLEVDVSKVSVPLDRLRRLAGTPLSGGTR